MPKHSSPLDDLPAGALLRVLQVEGELTPAQRNFNRLTAQITRARAQLADWDAAIDRLQQRVTDEMNPALLAIAGLQRQLAMQIDELLTHPPAGLKLTRRRRDGLIAFLLDRIDDALGNTTDEQLERLHDHYSDISLADRRDIEQSIGLEIAERMVSEMYGEDFVGDHDAQSADELFEHIDERFSAQRAAEQRQREQGASKRKPNRRQAAAQARREEEAAAASQSLREVYRKLVSSLHPDRESDPDERARKTALMKDINRAYQNNDLLSLLNLQMEVEQISAASLASMPVQRLLHYNEVLREQLRVLNDELKSRAVHLQDFPGNPGRPLRDPKDADQLLTRQLRELGTLQAHVLQTIEALANPYQRTSEIDAIVNSVKRR